MIFPISFQKHPTQEYFAFLNEGVQFRLNGFLNRFHHCSHLEYQAIQVQSTLFPRTRVLQQVFIILNEE
jgi:hypothetical protein